MVFPESDQYVPESVAVELCQLARPVASETRNLPTPGVPQVIFTCPATSSADPGVIVPIPIFPQALYIQVPTFQAPLRK